MTQFEGENIYIYGLHDRGGEHLLIENGTAKGWVLVTEAIGSEAHEQGGGNYADLAGKGLGVIVRLNQSYGENGTIPREARYPEFAQRCANFAQNSQGAHIWVIGNEMNFSREQPRQEGSSEPEPITPRRYAKCYRMVRQKIKAVPGHQNDLVVVGAPAPWNAQTTYEADPDGKYPANPTGDWVDYLRDILLAIGPTDCDAIAIHTYSHGYAPELVFSDAKMNPPFQDRHYHFYAYRDQMNAIPENMRHLPVYITEMNGDREPNGDTWPFGNNGWIQNAYKEIDTWNKSGRQQIRCGILFRWQKDPLGWSIDGKPEVQQDLKQAMAHNYRWNPDAAKPKPKPVPPTETARPTTRPAARPTVIPRPEVPGYRARYLSHNTPSELQAGQTLTITLNLLNAGSFTWVTNGANPFRLGFQWYDAAGKPVQLPANSDFRTSLPRDIKPNEQVTLQARLRTPEAPGVYQLRWDMVHEMITWFASQGDAGLLVSPLTVQQPVPQPQPQPQPKPEPQPQPQPVPQPATPAHLQIQNISSQLAQHPSRRYVKRPLQAIKRIIVHHTATPANVTPQRIAEFQVNNRGLPGITYHFCTTDQGQAYQTQPLTVTAAHAGQNSRDSVGVCLIGNFTDAAPPEAQLDAAASVLAQLLTTLQLSPDAIFGYSEIVTTGSPGATWPQWKPTLLAKTKALLGQAAPAPDRPDVVKPERKPLEHVLLFWYNGPGDWAEWDFRGALDYIDRFAPALCFSVEEAQFAQYVTIVGGVGGVSAEAEQILRNAGCQVERIEGDTETDTRRMLEEMAAKGQRFINAK